MCSDQETTFPERLKTALKGASTRAFARKAGVSEAFLRQCLSGRSEPTRPILISLAMAADVPVEWLACGVHGAVKAADMAREPAARYVALAVPVLVAAVESVEEGLAATGRVMEPGKKAELIVAVYELLADPDNKIDKSAIVRLVKTAA